VAYTSISDATAGVQAALAAFNDLYQQGKYTDQDRARVKVAYEIWQKAALLATRIAQAATTPAEQATALAQANAASNAFLATVRGGS
jgi:hypothetical protein